MSTYSTLGYVVWATIAWSAAMTAQLRRFRRSPTGSSSPILSVELAATHEQFDRVLGQSDRQQNARTIRTNTYMDFLFILLYTTIFLLLASIVYPSIARWIRLTILITAALDVLENLSILSEIRRVLAASGKGSPPFHFSIAKWGVFGLTLCFTGFAQLQGRQFPYHVFVSLVVLGAGACSLIGLVFHRMISWSVLLLMPALVLIGVVAFRV